MPHPRSPQIDPKWSYAFNEAVAVFNSSPTFLDLVRNFHTRGHQFSFQRQHPGVAIDGVRYRLKHLNLLDWFRHFIHRREGFAPTLVHLNAETKAFHIRLNWIGLSGFGDDLVDQRLSIERFAYFIPIGDINDAVSKAWAAPSVANRNHRWRYVCSILNPLMNEHRANREAAKAALKAAFA